MTANELLDQFLEALQNDPEIGPEMGVVNMALMMVPAERAVVVIERVATIWNTCKGAASV